MANVYVFRHLSGGNNYRNAGVLSKRLYNGQLIFFTGDKWHDSTGWLHLFYYWDYNKKNSIKTFYTPRHLACQQMEQ